MYGSQWHRQNKGRCRIHCSQNHIRLRRINSANFSEALWPPRRPTYNLKQFHVLKILYTFL